MRANGDSIHVCCLIGARALLAIAVSCLVGFPLVLASPGRAKPEIKPETNSKPPVLPRIPAMFSLNPLGARRSTTQQVEILGENLDGASSLQFDDDGVKARILRSTYLSAVAEVTIAPEAKLGIHCARLFSPLGVSNLLGFRVGILPEVPEREPNNSRQTAQALTWPSVVDGTIFPDEDADFYKIRGRAGQKVTIEVLASRIGSGLNSELYLLDERGRRLTVGDDEEDLDPVIHYVFADDRNYYVVVRSVFSVLNISFPTGHPAYTYQLRVAAPPHIGFMQPFGARPGQSINVELVGDSLQSVQRLEVSPPGIAAEVLEAAPGRIRARLRIDQNAAGRYDIRGLAPEGLSNPVRFVVSDLPVIHEQEPNDDFHSANWVTIPAVVEGGIGHPGDEDNFLFSLDQKGDYVFEVEAGRFNSDLDSVISFYDATGKLLAENDDGVFTSEPAACDSRLEYRFASAGQFTIRIRQAILKLNGPAYHYRLVMRPASPHFALLPGSGGEAFPAVRAKDRWVGEAGTKIEIPVEVLWLEGLEGLGASVKVSLEGLPPGVNAESVWATVKDGKYSSPNEPFTGKVKIPVSILPGAHQGNFQVRVKGETYVGSSRLTAWETIPVSVVGQYVMSATGGFSKTLGGAYLSIVPPARFMLQPEIGDLRYPMPFSMQPGTRQDLVINVIAHDDFRSHLQFSAVNLPKGVRIEGFDRRPSSNQYVLHLRAEPKSDTGWFPMVAIIGTCLVDGKIVAAATPYFGMAVQ